jgi:CRISPR/Cas system CSM-associated protein Csm3 (group 7 of RAMP superfamily)
MSTLVITGKLETRTALHVGSGQSSSEADALLRRNGAGELFIPGSAVAGSLRALATRLAPRLGGGVCKALQRDPAKGSACGCTACRLFGDVEPQEENTEAGGGRASRLWVYDARPTKQSPTTIRDGVGIDRRTGAAARLESVKFDLEVLPAGATFDLHLELEEAEDQDEQLLAAVLAEWQAGRGSLGGRAARGLGAFRLTGVKCQQKKLNNATTLMAFLRSDEPIANLAEVRGWLPSKLTKARGVIVAEGDNPWIAQSWLEVELTLQATGPFLAGDVTTARRSGFDHAPLVEGWPVLPGASLRGVLRSQAERIACTLATRWAQDEDDFLQSCPACSPVARPKDKAKSVPLECCDSLLDKSVDEEVEENELCLACRLFGSAGLGSRLIVEDAPLKEGTEPRYKVQDFLAIDRFTGGGREGAKFDAAVLWQPAFSARLRLENPRDWELGWLALVLRDLAEGWLTVGFGRAKGLGQVTAPQWTVRFGFLDPTDFPGKTDLIASASAPSSSLYRVLELNGHTIVQDGKITWTLLDGAGGKTWFDQVETWGQAFSGQVKEFRREALPELPRDSYFGQNIFDLYPREVRSNDQS